MKLTLREWLEYKLLKLETFCLLNFGKDRYGAIKIMDLRIVNFQDECQFPRSRFCIEVTKTKLKQRYKTNEVWNLGNLIALFNEDED